MSQQSFQLLSLTVVATTAIVGNRFVTIGGAQAGQGGDAFGAALTAASIGDAMAVATIGTAILEAGAAINIGDPLQSDALGRAVPQTNGLRLAIALQAATATGQTVEVLLKRS
ncbi:MAG: DUF2190 family protein [Magnetococcales bacterium]|nr:DUF2190 family protein [Magnetococcales bacterium]